MSEDVDHPGHYGGDTDYEVIKVLEAWDLELAKGFCWGNLIKYTARAGKKGSEVSDRLKAEWYATRLATITTTLEGQKVTAASSEHEIEEGWKQVGQFNWVRTEGQPAGQVHWTMNDKTRPDNCEMPDFRKDGK